MATGGRRPGGSDETLDPGLRETAANSVLRWRRRLLSSPGNLDPQAIASVVHESGQLAAVASSRGAPRLATLAGALKRALEVPPADGTAAIGALSEYLDIPAREAPAGALGGTVLGSRAPMPSAPPAREPAPVGDRLLSEPPLLSSRMGARQSHPPAPRSLSIAPPPAVAPPAAAPHASKAPDMSGTKMSQGGELRSPQGASRAPARAPAPSPRDVTPPAALPRDPPPPALPADVPPPPRPPELVGTVLGLRAFGRGGRKASPVGPTPPAQGILGLRRGPFGAPPPDNRKRSEEPFARAAKTMARRSPRGATASGRRTSIPAWSIGLLGAFALLGGGVVSVVVISGRRGPGTAGPPPQVASAVSSASAAPGATSPAVVSGGPEADSLIARVHERGKESPELRSLLETQGKLALRCKDDPRTCGQGWTPLARDAFSAVPSSALQVLAPEAQRPLPPWLQRLKIPADLGIRDDVALRSLFDLNTKNIAGRQRFQAKVFDCGAYEDIFESTFVKYGAPTWLTAVVYQESGCNPRATSPVGAKGLWQFMPESARAYGLRVVDGEVDERVNPVKSTDAAVHFLTDLQRKLGSWDLVLAAYNMGPFAVLARLAHFGDKAGFWELAHANLLPEETAGYVPAIEAYALALQNLSRLQFSRDGRRLEATAEIVVKPGMRLSLLARAASTTTLHIRELNPEFLRDVVPEGETSARVPDDEAHRAEAFLQSWSPDDSRDTCVPEDFDWGAKQFESSRFAKNCNAAAPSP